MGFPVIPDGQTDTVYLSDLLPGRFPAIVQALRQALGNGLRIIPGTKDIWCRDYMPVQIAEDRFVQFRYQPDYLRDYPDCRTTDGASLLGVKNCSNSELVVDGGNVVRWNDTVVMTEKVYRENRSIEPSRLRARLRRLLEVKRLVVIPPEGDDPIGHSDGMVRFVDADTVLVNDYRPVDPKFGQQVAAVLQRHRLNVIPFPYQPTHHMQVGIPSAEGVYLNFAQTKDTILLPVFGQAEDDKAATLLAKTFPHHQIVPVPCTALAMEGGVLNCVTWNIKALTGGLAVCDPAR